MSSLEKIVISACLLGEKVRYDGNGNGLDSDLLELWQAQGRLLVICPEVAGGLGIPRPAAEITGGDGHSVRSKNASIVTIDGDDVTAQFTQGAEMALKLALKHKCRYAILAARSPSCGNELIYDGSFQNRLKAGVGVTTALLQQNGIQVFNQTQLQQLNSLLDS